MPYGPSYSAFQRYVVLYSTIAFLFVVEKKHNLTGKALCYPFCGMPLPGTTCVLCKCFWRH